MRFVDEHDTGGMAVKTLRRQIEDGLYFMGRELKIIEKKWDGHAKAHINMAHRARQVWSCAEAIMLLTQHRGTRREESACRCGCRK